MRRPEVQIAAREGADHRRGRVTVRRSRLNPNAFRAHTALCACAFDPVPLLPNTCGVGHRWSIGLLCVIAACVLVGFAGSVDALRPGDRIGSMQLVRGTAATADLKLFDICDPVILRPGRFQRRCAPVPRVQRLFIGHGEFAAPRAINRVWNQSAFTAWFDGRRIHLRSFGTSDRPLYSFPPAGFKTVTLREWRVIVVNPTPGLHTLRYRTTDASGAADVTWVFAVRRS